MSFVALILRHRDRIMVRCRFLVRRERGGPRGVSRDQRTCPAIRQGGGRSARDTATTKTSSVRLRKAAADRASSSRGQAGTPVRLLTVFDLAIPSAPRLWAAGLAGPWVRSVRCDDGKSVGAPTRDGLVNAFQTPNAGTSWRDSGNVDASKRYPNCEPLRELGGAQLNTNGQAVVLYGTSAPA